MERMKHLFSEIFIYLLLDLNSYFCSSLTLTLNINLFMLFFVIFLPSLFYSNYIHLLFRLIGYWNAKKQMHE